MTLPETPEITLLWRDLGKFSEAPVESFATGRNGAAVRSNPSVGVRSVAT